MSPFDICVIVLLSAAFVAVVARLVYNKIKGRGSSCGDCSGCSGCSGCSHCSACSNGGARNAPEEK